MLLFMQNINGLSRRITGSNRLIISGAKSIGFDNVYSLCWVCAQVPTPAWAIKVSKLVRDIILSRCKNC